MLLVVIGIGVVALLALLVGIISGSILMGWFTVGASSVGLLLLVVDELRERGSNDVEQDAGDHAPPPRVGLDEPTGEELDFAPEPELTHNEEELRPEIWPPDHLVRETGGDDDRVGPRQARGGEVPRPDIWP